ncbi:protein SIEVE ELEMENT OCCLUSION B-like [Camellia sinensis]|uniref:protein SIEVE ELEMENT OCCLUSION B-like n=1 Tax=Camellia sinensis TaxID=4442 RepID=UPI001035CE15|nr:protein SIEVE ELEMENT OCCLUSION B-like [Camellia sinensis]
MAASKVTPGSMTQLIKGDRSMLMMSYDNVMMKQIQGTHNPDGRKIDVKPILHIVVDILSRATMPVETSIVLGMRVQGHMEHFEEKGQQGGVINMLEALSLIIRQLSSEQAYKCQIGMDGHQITISLFTVLSNYSWDAKLVLALAAYASNYGAFRLLAQMYTSNQLAKSMALLKRLPVTVEHSEEKRNLEAYVSLVRLMQMIHLDSMKVLRALIYAKDDLLPLFDGSAKRRVNLEVLRRKNVLLLISGLDISMDELSILEQIYNDSRHQGTRLDNLYEMVWIPVVDRSVQWTDPMQKQFERLQSTMPWYTVHQPSLIDRVVIRFIREKWHFRNKAILVVLDPQGKVVRPNAIHMMWIWGSNAFPFTSAREEALWREETWKIELLVNGIDQTILNWVNFRSYRAWLTRSTAYMTILRSNSNSATNS